MISSYFRRGSLLDGPEWIRVANLAIHFGTQPLQLLDTELYSLLSVAIVTFVGPRAPRQKP